VARALRDAGMEVVYLGLRNTPAQIASAAVQEDVDAVGLSVLSGSHLPLARKVLAALADEGGADVPVVLGGTIPPEDVPALEELGIAAVLPTSTTLDEVVATVRRLVEGTRGTSRTARS
jgi:methylmalonyl-CoA mutase C-terminal domain/subunit